jgi:hypothetical protein
MIKTEVKITQNPDAPVAVEVLAEAISAISRGTQKMLAGPLNEKAIVLLITHATPAVAGWKPSASTVRAVLRGMESLEREYLKK